MHGFRKVNKSCFFMLLKHHFNVGLEHWTRKAFLGWYSVSVDSTCSVCVGNLKLRPYKSGRHWAFISCGSVCDAVHVVRVAPCQVIWIPESGKCLEIPNPRLWKPESGIPLKSEIRNPSSTDRKLGIQYLESGIHIVESRIQDSLGLPHLYYYMRNFCNLIGLE